MAEKNKLFYNLDGDETYYVEIDNPLPKSFTSKFVDVYEVDLDGNEARKSGATGNFKIGVFLSSINDDLFNNLAAKLLCDDESGEFFPISFDLVRMIQEDIDSDDTLPLSSKLKYDWLKNHLLNAISLIDSIKFKDS
jgi:hypothetical protein